MKQSDNLKLFCITNKQLNFLEDLSFFLAGVGKKKFLKKLFNMSKR